MSRQLLTPKSATALVLAAEYLKVAIHDCVANNLLDAAGDVTALLRPVLGLADDQVKGLQDSILNAPRQSGREGLCIRAHNWVPVVSEKINGCIPGWMNTRPRPYKSLVLNEISALRNRGKIHAIKLFRDRTGLGLKESKDAVEAYIRTHGLRENGTSGCYL